MYIYIYIIYYIIIYYIIILYYYIIYIYINYRILFDFVFSDSLWFTIKYETNLKLLCLIDKFDSYPGT